MHPWFYLELSTIYKILVNIEIFDGAHEADINAKTTMEIEFHSKGFEFYPSKTKESTRIMKARETQPQVFMIRKPSAFPFLVKIKTEPIQILKPWDLVIYKN